MSGSYPRPTHLFVCSLGFLIINNYFGFEFTAVEGELASRERLRPPRRGLDDEREIDS